MLDMLIKNAQHWKGLIFIYSSLIVWQSPWWILCTGGCQLENWCVIAFRSGTIDQYSIDRDMCIYYPGLPTGSRFIVHFTWHVWVKKFTIGCDTIWGGVGDPFSIVSRIMFWFINSLLTNQKFLKYEENIWWKIAKLANSGHYYKVIRGTKKNSD